MVSKKMLLMGPGRSGKTSIRNIVFCNYMPRDTVRLGTTIELDESKVTFLADLQLNLWDCGGQLKYIDHYLQRQTECIFSNVCVLIFVFDINALSKDDGGEAVQSGDQSFSFSTPGLEWTRTAVVEYFKLCVHYLQQHSPDARVFGFLNKIDLVNADLREKVVTTRQDEILSVIQPDMRNRVTFFTTSIWNHTLFTAWSTVMHALVPKVEILHRFLERIRVKAGATEAAVFDRSTFLCICNSTDPQLENDRSPDDPPTTTQVTNIIKKLRKKKLSSGEGDAVELESLELTARTFRAAMLPFTSHTFLLLVMHETKTPVTLLTANAAAARAAFLQHLETSAEAEPMRHIL